MNEEQGFDLGQSLAQTFGEVIEFLAVYAPQIVGAVVLLILGWVTARLLETGVRRLIGGFDSVFSKVFRVDGSQQAKMRISHAKGMGRLVFWVVFLFFVAAAANLFGWTLFTNWVNSLVVYLPNLITGLLIIMVGVLLGTSVRPLVARAAASIGMIRAELVGQLTQLVIILTLALIGVEQAGIDVHFLTDLLVVLSGVLLAGGALAFGLGARSLAANVIGAQDCRKHCQSGDSIQIEELEGTIVEISQTAIILETSDGRAVVPARLFQEKVVRFPAEKKPEAGTGADNAGETQS